MVPKAALALRHLLPVLRFPECLRRLQAHHMRRVPGTARPRSTARAHFAIGSRPRTVVGGAARMSSRSSDRERHSAARPPASRAAPASGRHARRLAAGGWHASCRNRVSSAAASTRSSAAPRPCAPCRPAPRASESRQPSLHALSQALLSSPLTRFIAD